MTLSINTNAAALNALQQLSATSRNLDEAQMRINTGLKVANAKDNAAVFAIAQNMRADLDTVNVIKDSMNRAASVLDVTMAAAESAQNLLTQMKSKLVAASDAGLDQASREAYRRDFENLRDQLGNVVKSANFNGINLIDGVSGVALSAIVSVSGSLSINVPRTDLQLAPANTTVFSQPRQQPAGNFTGSFVHLATNTSFSTAAQAQALIANLDNSIKNVSVALTVIGTGAKAVEIQQAFVTKLGDALETGIGNLVDADIARESARLQALQVKQQLGVQALTIANAQPSILLSLFR